MQYAHGLPTRPSGQKQPFHISLVEMRGALFSIRHFCIDLDQVNWKMRTHYNNFYSGNPLRPLELLWAIDSSDNSNSSASLTSSGDGSFGCVYFRWCVATEMLLCMKYWFYCCFGTAYREHMAVWMFKIHNTLQYIIESYYGLLLQTMIAQQHQIDCAPWKKAKKKKTSNRPSQNEENDVGGEKSRKKVLAKQIQARTRC